MMCFNDDMFLQLVVVIYNDSTLACCRSRLYGIHTTASRVSLVFSCLFLDKNNRISVIYLYSLYFHNKF